MPNLFFDSSGLIKRYIAETGTSWVTELLNPAATNNIFIANITGIEIVSAITRRTRGGDIDSVMAQSALTRFKSDFATRFIVVDLKTTIVEQGIALAETPWIARLRYHSACRWACRKKSIATKRDPGPQVYFR